MMLSTIHYFNNINWKNFILFLICIKVTIYCFDPLPMFFLGDSQSYIATALNGWIPPDRSFLYGYFIKVVSITTHDIRNLVMIQVFLSFITTLILVYCLEFHMSVRRGIVFLIGFIFSIAPLQLLYERYILTETLSIFVLSIYILTLFEYIKSRCLFLLFLFQIIGTILIGLRLSFLPVVIINSLLIPIIARHNSKQHHSSKFNLYQLNLLPSTWIKKYLTLGTSHVIVSVGLLFTFHFAYANLNGYLIGRPPAYQYESGFFLISDLAPILTIDDFTGIESSANFQKNLKFDLSNRNLRGVQRWSAGGIVSSLLNTYEDPLKADAVAKQIAMHAIKRDPIGFADLAIDGFTDYWNKAELIRSMMVDRGSDRDLPPDFIKVLQEQFGLQGNGFQKIETFTNKLYFFLWPWYVFLLLSPLFFILSIFVSKNENRKQLFVVFILVIYQVSISSILIERPTVRYLHALEWMIFIPLAVMMERAFAYFDLKN